jgi:hypothetical protein
MWSHRPNSIKSGSMMCRKTSSVKNRSPMLPRVKKLRAIGSLKIGSQSNHSLVTTAMKWASWSHTSQYPLMPVTISSSSTPAPVTHVNARAPR